MINVCCVIVYIKELGQKLLDCSVQTSDVDSAAEVIIVAKFFNYELLWTLVGVGGIVLVVSCVCCIAVRDMCRYCHSRGCSLTQWSPQKLPQRKYRGRNKESYETCVICQEDFNKLELVRVLPCKHSKLHDLTCTIKLTSNPEPHKRQFHFPVQAAN